MSEIRLAASILSADFLRLGEQAREAVAGGTDWLHVDVMDGAFVPNLSVGPDVVRALHPLCRRTGVWLDVHLMTQEPERHLAAFAGAGADVLTVHVEACTHLHRTLGAIRELGARAGVALNPATPLSALEEILGDVDLVTMMSVDPGFGGQSFLPRSIDRIRRLRRMLDAAGSAAWLEVDGGIHPANASEAVAAGATVLVAGNAVFRGERSIAGNLEALRRQSEAASHWEENQCQCV